jgi:2-methylisocitrate lyase-like PEP mutase family enzyme
MTRLSRFFNSSVSVQTYLGSNSRGDQFATAATVACYIEDATKLTRNANAEEVVSTTTLYAAIDAAPQFTPGSKVMLNGRTAFVITTNRQDSAGPARIHHTQVALT